MKIFFLIIIIVSLALLYCYTDLTVNAQSDLETTKHRNIIIELDNGLETNARLNLPASGDGPFPGVLLVHGSGPLDMNETTGVIRIDNDTGSIIYPSSRPYFEIAQYLSERGFAVLQYNKRGIGESFTVLDSNVWGNATVQDLKRDAEKALGVLIQQPEVDASDITLVGHSEGTTIVPRVAIDNPGKVNNIVLMGALAQNISDLGYYQGVTLPLLYAQENLDHNHNGLISVQEADRNPIFNTIFGNLTLFLAQNITATNGTTIEQLNPQYNMNNDTFISINEELKPRIISLIKSLPSQVATPGEKCDPHNSCPIWIITHYPTPTLDIISKVPSDTSILIQQGKNDSQTPIQQALLLEQELTEAKHPDHTLITYSDLGHAFSPSSQWVTALGPMEPKVLEDLFSWLSDPVRDFKKLSIISSGVP